MRPSMLASPIGWVEGLLRLAGSRSGPSTIWLKSAIAMYVKSRLEMVSLTPRYWRSMPTNATHKPPASMPQTAIASFTSSGASPAIA